MNSPQLVEAFMKQFKKVSGGLHLSHKEGSFFRCASMYIDGRWNYDHEYFQIMIDRDNRMNAEIVGCIITGISALSKDDLSNNNDSMPSLQDRGREDSSRDNGTDSYGDNGMYNDGE